MSHSTRAVSQQPKKSVQAKQSEKTAQPASKTDHQARGDGPRGNEKGKVAKAAAQTTQPKANASSASQDVSTFEQKKKDNYEALHGIQGNTPEQSATLNKTIDSLSQTDYSLKGTVNGDGSAQTLGESIILIPFLPRNNTGVYGKEEYSHKAGSQLLEIHKDGGMQNQSFSSMGYQQSLLSYTDPSGNTTQLDAYEFPPAEWKLLNLERPENYDLKDQTYDNAIAQLKNGGYNVTPYSNIVGTSYISANKSVARDGGTGTVSQELDIFKDGGMVNRTETEISGDSEIKTYSYPSGTTTGLTNGYPSNFDFNP